MTSGRGPTTTRRRLSTQLRNLRGEARMSVEQVAREVEWSPSKLVRIENGQVGISVSDLTALLHIYDVRDPEQTDALKKMARGSRQRAWWSGLLLPPSYIEFIGAEYDASEIHHFHPTLIPGLLQTPEYAHAIVKGISPDDLSDADVEARVQARVLRQEHVLQREDPPRYVAMIDEAVLRRPVGGDAVMRAQIDSLMGLIDAKRIALVIVPFSAGPHLGLSGAYALMEYEDLGDAVVALETTEGNFVLREQPDVIKRHRRAVDHLLRVGIAKDDALRFVGQVRKDYN